MNGDYSTAVPQRSIDSNVFSVDSYSSFMPTNFILFISDLMGCGDIYIWPFCIIEFCLLQFAKQL
jgi:hypothetical protein